MNTLCTRCALWVRRATAQAEPLPLNVIRAFSRSSPTRKHHGVPAFTATGNPELDDVLLSMRQTHFIPAYLSEPERRMIFGTKHRQQLLDNPQSVIIGDEEIELKWIDRRKEIPNRTKLFHKAISLMSASSEGGHEGEAKAWENLPALLTGLKKAHAVPPEKAMAKIVRKAVGCGRIGIIIQCLHQVEHTGMSLQMPEVLNNVIYGLRTLAQKDGWSEEALGKALKDSQQIAILLEMKEHGGGGIIKTNDARGRKEVIGVFLELAAMHAYKFQNGKDVDGKVKMYAERLMDRLEFASQPPSSTPPSNGPVYSMLNAVPILNGLRLAQKILDEEMPKSELANKLITEYEAALTSLAAAIEAQRPSNGSYGDQALRVWLSVTKE
ncbi:hypothetical protein M433DRAFT_111160 [Acidomyces richmondensis BFW]|nr:MAG: hypothetical protein FE78DRAFT_105757 [Acidomyces sp. 'richmondensis']KYG43955.1 hypothetical protein M433DRAFT_111160 [Acidomyces richmondensis BFW]